MNRYEETTIKDDHINGDNRNEHFSCWLSLLSPVKELSNVSPLLDVNFYCSNEYYFDIYIYIYKSLFNDMHAIKFKSLELLNHNQNQKNFILYFSNIEQ